MKNTTMKKPSIQLANRLFLYVVFTVASPRMSASTPCKIDAVPGCANLCAVFGVHLCNGAPPEWRSRVLLRVCV